MKLTMKKAQLKSMFLVTLFLVALSAIVYATFYSGSNLVMQRPEIYPNSDIFSESGTSPLINWTVGPTGYVLYTSSNNSNNASIVFSCSFNASQTESSGENIANISLYIYNGSFIKNQTKSFESDGVSNDSMRNITAIFDIIESPAFYDGALINWMCAAANLSNQSNNGMGNLTWGNTTDPYWTIAIKRAPIANLTTLPGRNPGASKDKFNYSLVEYNASFNVISDRTLPLNISIHGNSTKYKCYVYRNNTVNNSDGNLVKDNSQYGVLDDTSPKVFAYEFPRDGSFGWQLWCEEFDDSLIGRMVLNKSPSNWSTLVDTAAPLNITVNSPRNNSIIDVEGGDDLLTQTNPGSKNVTFQVTVADATDRDSLACHINLQTSNGTYIFYDYNKAPNVGNESSTWNDTAAQTLLEVETTKRTFTWANLSRYVFSDGEYNWSVSCGDKANNWVSSGNYTFTLDLTNPTISYSQYLNTSGGHPQAHIKGWEINISTNESVNNSWMNISTGGVKIASIKGITTNNLNHSFVLNRTLFLDDRDYNFTITVCDLAGNCFIGGNVTATNIRTGKTLYEGWNLYGILHDGIPLGILGNQTNAEYLYWWNATYQEWVSWSDSSTSNQNWNASYGEVIWMYTSQNTSWSWLATNKNEQQAEYKFNWTLIADGTRWSAFGRDERTAGDTGTDSCRNITIGHNYLSWVENRSNNFYNSSINMNNWTDADSNYSFITTNTTNKYNFTFFASYNNSAQKWHNYVFDLGWNNDTNYLFDRGDAYWFYSYLNASVNQTWIQDEACNSTIIEYRW